MKKDNIFWVGYSDLMTSLFFVMLVLFVVTIGYLKYNLETTKEQLEKIHELQTAVQQLPEEYFEYQAEYKRFKLNKQIQFDKDSATIKNEYLGYLTKVGESIVELIEILNNNINSKKFDIKYLVVIEGMASKDRASKGYNYRLSYQRAYAVYEHWTKNNIKFDNEICEVQISGSGIGGIREYFGHNENMNQQILIHIIPKMGKIQKDDKK